MLNVSTTKVCISGKRTENLYCHSQVFPTKVFITRLPGKCWHCLCVKFQSKSEPFQGERRVKLPLLMTSAFSVCSVFCQCHKININKRKYVFIF